MKNPEEFHKVVLELEDGPINPMFRPYKGNFYVSDSLNAAPLKVGSMVIKQHSKATGVPDGTIGIIVGSVADAQKTKRGEEYLYAIIWEGIDAVFNVTSHELKAFHHEGMNDIQGRIAALLDNEFTEFTSYLLHGNHS